MANNKPRSTDYFDQGAEGRFEPVVETPKSKFVPIENVPSAVPSAEDILVLCEEAILAGDEEVKELVREILESSRTGSEPKVRIFRVRAVTLDRLSAGRNFCPRCQ